MANKEKSLSNENQRLRSFDGESHSDHPWLRWGPYLSERSWGTVREDYSHDGNAWDYLPHDYARSRAYRCGEDGLAGISDRYQVLNFACAFWNKKDPILKERLFGLVPTEGNHGEDVKEYYFYLDSTPTHSYMKYLYKYPQEEFPYNDLVQTNAQRNLKDREYELLDTGVFDQNRYFDIYIEYAKAEADDIGIRITVHNRSSEKAPLYVLPHLWFRNRWSFNNDGIRRKRPKIEVSQRTSEFTEITADDTELGPILGITHEYVLGPYYFYAEGNPRVLFTHNETHAERVWNGRKSDSPYVKDAFHRYLINGEECISKEESGTKMTFHYGDVEIEPHSSRTFYLRLSKSPHKTPFKDIKKLFSNRIKEADAFYENIHPKGASKEEKEIQRQAFAGMLWSKQFYMFHVGSWLKKGYFDEPPPEGRRQIRNNKWGHLDCKQIISMPDKWEYPWFAAWDLAFHTISLAQIDIEFAKQQLWLLLFEQFMHPSGQIPAYEWEFSDLNPPVQAWAIWRVYQEEVQEKGKGDHLFLLKCYHKLMMNFCWWVNKVDNSGNNIFEGGFLGLDNISVIDRSESLPSGEEIEQSDGTGWMGLFSILMMRISLELAKTASFYEELAVKFFEHFVWISASLETHDNRQAQMWNEEDGFFYDVVSYPDKSHVPLKIRSMVGLIPLFAVDSISEEDLERFPVFAKSFRWFLKNRKPFAKRCITKTGDHYFLSMMHLDQAKSLLGYIWDPNEFRSEFGLRSLSKFHKDSPFVFEGRVVDYEPGEESISLKGGNSNWRGPIWFPTTYLLLVALRKYDSLVGEQLKIKDHEGKTIPLKKVIQTLSEGMLKLFKKDKQGHRPIHGDYEKFQTDPNWKDLILFYEHYHGDNGRGLGASHQTGWSGLISKIIEELRQ